MLRFNQPSHALATIVMTLVRFFRPGRGRSSTMMCSLLLALRMAFCTVVRLTPATAAIRSIGRSQQLLRFTSWATTQSAARSPSVYSWRMHSGMPPPPPHVRRRLRDASRSGDTGRSRTPLGMNWDAQREIALARPLLAFWVCASPVSYAFARASSVHFRPARLRSRAAETGVEEVTGRGPPYPSGAVSLLQLSAFRARHRGRRVDEAWHCHS